MATLRDITAQIEKLQREADEIRRREIAAVIADIREKMDIYGITAADLGFGEVRDLRSVVPPKYKKGKLIWTGRGRRPKWVDEYIGRGGKLEDLLIRKS